MHSPHQSPPHLPHQPPPHSPHQSPPHSPHQSPPRSPNQSPPHSPHQSTPHSPHQSPPYSPPHYSPPRSYEGRSTFLKRVKNQRIRGGLIQIMMDDILVVSWESQEEDISPTILEAAKTLFNRLLLRVLEGIDAEEEITTEDWDAIRAKLEANAELTKDVLGKDLPEQDFAKRMVDMVNQRKKHFAEERAKAKRNKPMTQSQLRIYMSNYLKNQGTWKLSQLKKLTTKAKLKRYGEELQTKTSKKQKIDDKDVPAIGEKVAEVKEEEPVKRTGKRKKQKARKGISVDKNAQGDSETDKEESVEAMNPTPLATKSNIVVNWKIFQQGQRSIYQIMRANGADTVYMSFGAMVKDFTREDLIELYSWYCKVWNKIRPKDAYDIVLWKDSDKNPFVKDILPIDAKGKASRWNNEMSFVIQLLKMIEKQAGKKVMRLSVTWSQCYFWETMDYNGSEKGFEVFANHHDNKD
ncbi:hypothetical protein Tco_0180858 [Tanacetum coccineum]